MSVLIRGGRVITASDDYVADLFLDDGRIAMIGSSLDLRADRVIDARDRYVLPGMLDPHTHFETPSFGTESCDDFTIGSRSAAFGGNTSLIHFAQQEPGQGISEAVEDWKARLSERPPVVDVGFHLIVKDLTVPRALDELAALPGQGIPSFKVFMAYKGQSMVDDETLFKVMQVAARAGAMVMVHAENGSVIEVLREQAVARGEMGTAAHGTTRPPLTEAEAVSRAIYLATIAGANLYVVHVSCAEALEPIIRARAAGLHVWAETCTQYLCTQSSDLSRPDFEGAKFVFTPPPRSEADWGELWKALSRDVLSVISSDHSPFRWRDQKTLGIDDFRKIPNGGPGVEDRLAVVHQLGVREGRITLNRMVQLLSTNPARLFGLFPRKGTIAVGSDADLVVFDPAKEMVLSSARSHSNCDYSLQEGRKVTGSPELVLVRGEVVVDNDRLCVGAGYGRFLSRPPAGAGRDLTVAAAPCV